MTQTLVAACTSDFSGLVRGKGFARTDLDRRIARGIGWTPTNVQITCFDSIAHSPYGAMGDLLLMPDPATLTDAPLPSGRQLAFLLGDIRTLDGDPWECCTRGILSAALSRFEAATGLRLMATFEHEFMLPGSPPSAGFSLAGFADGLPFAEALLAALSGAGIAPDSFLREYGPDQYEVTVPPQPALRAADEAVILRELTRAVARDMGLRATFAPLLAPDIVGNGVHVHLSLWTPDGQPATHDPAGTAGLSPVAASFVAGLLRHAPAAVALTAPAVVSYDRLTPHRWSAAYTNLAVQDREATVRVCPVTGRDPEARARGFNVEFRAADAAASPYLALAALVIAGTLGVTDRLPPARPTTGDLSLLPAADLAALSIARLPESLQAALAALAADAPFRAGLPGAMPAIYAAHKAGELAFLADHDPDQRRAAYAAVY